MDEQMANDDMAPQMGDTPAMEPQMGETMEPQMGGEMMEPQMDEKPHKESLVEKIEHLIHHEPK